MPPYEIAAFYRFTELPQYTTLRAPMQALCTSHGIKGILLLAAEGINGTLAGEPDKLAIALEEIRSLAGIERLSVKQSFAAEPPFLRMKVRLKQEIVTIGDPSVDPLAQTGVEIEPEAWNALIGNPDITVIDVRNGFEVAVGTFAGALNPQTAAFSDFPAFVREHLDPGVHKKIAMFCTGGIRCEKASSFMLGAGFQNVYQLKGGILTYLERIPSHESLWEGACFVFDGRVAVGHGLEAADVSTCFGCRHPLNAADRADPEYEDGVTCRHCSGLTTPAQKASARERNRQVRYAAAHGAMHLGPDAQVETERQAVAHP